MDSIESFKANYKYSIVNTSHKNEVKIAVHVILFNQSISIQFELAGTGERISLIDGKTLINGNLEGNVCLDSGDYSLLGVFQKIEGEASEYIGITFESDFMEDPLFVNLGKAVVSREMLEQQMNSGENQADVFSVVPTAAPTKANFRFVNSEKSSDNLQTLTVLKDLNGNHVYAFEVLTNTMAVPKVPYHLYTYVEQVDIKVTSNNTYGKVAEYHELPETLSEQLSNRTTASINYDTLLFIALDLLRWSDLYTAISLLDFTAYKNPGTLSAEYDLNRSFKSVTVKPKITTTIYTLSELLEQNFDKQPFIIALRLESEANPSLGALTFPFTATSNVVYGFAHGASSISYNRFTAKTASVPFTATM